MTLSARIQNFLKIGIAILAISFIAWKINQFENLEQTWNIFRTQLKQSNPMWLAFVLIGIPLHWIFEIIRWRRLILKTTYLTFGQAAIAVISGLTMAIFTPNRIGEIFTRVFVLPKNKRAEAVALTGINTFSLLIIIQFFGILGLAVYLNHPENGDIIPFLQKPIVPYVAMIISVILLVAYFNLNWIKYLSRILKIQSRYPGFTDVFSKLKLIDKIENLFWSAAKYMTYTLQYYFLLKYMGLDGSAGFLLPAIMAIYLIMNYLPVITIGEVGVKGSITLLMLEQGPESSIGILATALAIWILNLAIPAVIGSILLKKIRF